MGVDMLEHFAGEEFGNEFLLAVRVALIAGEFACQALKTGRFAAQSGAVAVVATFVAGQLGAGLPGQRPSQLGQQRGGDAAEMALIEFVKADDPGYKKSKGKKPAKGKKSKAPKADAPAAPAAEAAPAPETKS